MKRQFIIAASLATTALFFAACTTEDKQITPASSNKQAASYAVFSSIDEYESLFTDPNTVDEKADKVAARFGTYSEKARVSAWGEQDTLYPEFLQKILNDDYIVQIDKWLIKVNLRNESVFVLSKENANQYADLVSENISNSNISVFSTDDDVLDLLRNGNNSSTLRVNTAPSGEDKGFIGLPDGKRLDCKVVYQKAGVYFSLQAKANKQYKSDVGIWLPASYFGAQMLLEYKYIPKNKSLVSVQPFTKYAVQGETTNDISHRPYESIRGLEKYFYKVTFKDSGYQVEDPALGSGSQTIPFYTRPFVINYGF